MDVAGHAAAPQVAEQGQGEGVAHGVHVQVGHKLHQRLPSQEDGAHALAQQGEVGEQAGLHQDAVLQEDKVDGPRQHDVEATPRPLQDLQARHAQIARVHHEVDVLVPGREGGRMSAKRGLCPSHHCTGWEKHSLPNPEMTLKLSESGKIYFAVVS